MVIVINEQLWLSEYQEHGLGEPYGIVLNGAWELTFSDDLKEYWPSLYPANKGKVTSIRQAIKGESLFHIIEV